MTVTELKDNLNLRWITNPPEEDRQVTGCYIGDLLSWVMSRAQAGDVWITVQTNINIVAVATLTELACIIVPEDIVVDEGTVAKANLQGVAILGASQNSYQLAKLI